MDSGLLKNPFVKKMKLLTNLLVVSFSINIALFGTLSYHLAYKNYREDASKTLPEVVLKKEYTELFQHFFSADFAMLISELENKQKIADGYRICDLALGILTSYHYLDIEKALCGELLEEREVVFVHKDGGETFSLSLYPDIRPYHFSLIKAFVRENAYPFTAEGLFAELKIHKESSETCLVSSFMGTKEYIALYTFLHRFFDNLSKERLVLGLLSGSFQQMEKFYYLYLENMEKEEEMMRHFFHTYCKAKSSYIVDMWVEIDSDYILHQLDNSQLEKIVSLSSNTFFLQKVVKSPRNAHIRALAENKVGKEGVEVIAEVTVEVEEQEKEPSFFYYTVRDGDSLWLIAKRNKISIKKIQEENGPMSTILRPGQEMKIPIVN